MSKHEGRYCGQSNSNPGPFCNYLENHAGPHSWEGKQTKPEVVNHPQHYGGADNPYEAIKVIEAWGLGFCLGNAVKYICRSGKKGSELEDLRKAVWYLNRYVEQLEKKP